MPPIDTIEFLQDGKTVHKAACGVQPDEGYDSLAVPWNKAFADLLNKNPHVKALRDARTGLQDFTLSLAEEGKPILLQEVRPETIVSIP